jgi:signal peptidase I
MNTKLHQRFSEIHDVYKAACNYIKNSQNCTKICEQDAKVHQLHKLLQITLAELENEITTTSSALNEHAVTLKLNTAEALTEELYDLVKPAWKKFFDSFFVQVMLVFLLKTFIVGWYCVPTGCLEPNLLVGDRIYANKMAYWFNTVKRGDLVIFDNPEIPYSKNKLHALWQRFIGKEIKMLGLPAGPDMWVKRVIAIPGDTIEGRIEEDQAVLYRNGEKLIEPYVNPYPLICVQKINGFIDAKNPIIKMLPKAFTWPFIKRRSDNCDGVPSWYTYDPSASYEDQPFYRLKPQEILRNPLSGRPLLRLPDRPERYDTFMKITLPENTYWCQGDSRRNSKDSRCWGLLDGNLIRGKATMIVYSINSEEIWWLFDILKQPIDFWTKTLRANRSFSLLKNPLPESEQQ